MIDLFFSIAGDFIVASLLLSPGPSFRAWHEGGMREAMNPLVTKYTQ